MHKSLACRLLYNNEGMKMGARLSPVGQVPQVLSNPRRGEGPSFLKASVKGLDVVTAWCLIFLPWNDEGLR